MTRYKGLLTIAIKRNPNRKTRKSNEKTVKIEENMI
jgi:hypothetical protein